MKRQTLARVIGSSSTGTAHSLLLEKESDTTVRFTVVGHDGVKRHAAVILPIAAAQAITDALNGMNA